MNNEEQPKKRIIMFNLTTIYYLHDYNWTKGILLKENAKSFKIQDGAHITLVAKEKCAMPDELVCVVWESWKGKNGRGGYRVERELYPDYRLQASQVAYQGSMISSPGRVTEEAYGVLKVQPKTIKLPLVTAEDFANLVRYLKQ